MGLFLLLAIVPTVTEASAATSRWTIVPSAHDGIFHGISGRTASDLWVVGYTYDQPSGRYLPTTEHWDGVRFTHHAAPPASDGYNALNAVVQVGEDDVWAVGYQTPAFYPTAYTPLIEHWNGSTWSIVESPFTGPGQLTALAASSPSNVWAVGTRTTNPQGTLVLHYDGSTWSVVADGHRNDSATLQGVTIAPDGSVWAAGGTFKGHGDRATFVERWDGITWAAQPTQNDSEYNEFNAIDAGPSGLLWGVGWKSPGLGYFQFTEKYEQGSWEIEPTPDFGTTNNNLYGVVVLGPNRVWAVGYESFSPVIQRWAGDRWVVERDPATTCCALWAIGQAGRSLWAVGDSLIMSRAL
jgi:hypothetical protein